MRTSKISFIGGGNMAGSLIGGLVAGDCPAANLRVADPDAERLRELHERFGVATGTDNAALARGAEVIVLAVKPQVMAEVARGLAATVTAERPLVVSVAAGVRAGDLDRWLGGGAAIVRTMPNTPALVRSGATALYANAKVSNAQKDLAENIMRAVGLTVWVQDEGLMDAVTALSGSGPAYFFLLMEVLEQAGVELGLEREMARLLTLQTAFGAAKMALESPETAAALRARVTSPGGTTERAVKVLQEGDLQGLFSRALRAAKDRSRELAELIGGH